MALPAGGALNEVGETLRSAPAQASGSQRRGACFENFLGGAASEGESGDGRETEPEQPPGSAPGSETAACVAQASCRTQAEPAAPASATGPSNGKSKRDHAADGIPFGGPSLCAQVIVADQARPWTFSLPRSAVNQQQPDQGNSGAGVPAEAGVVNANSASVAARAVFAASEWLAPMPESGARPAIQVEAATQSATDASQAVVAGAAESAGAALLDFVLRPIPVVGAIAAAVTPTGRRSVAAMPAVVGERAPAVPGTGLRPASGAIVRATAVPDSAPATGEQSNCLSGAEETDTPRAGLQFELRLRSQSNRAGVDDGATLRNVPSLPEPAGVEAVRDPALGEPSPSSISPARLGASDEERQHAAGDTRESPAQEAQNAIAAATGEYSARGATGAAVPAGRWTSLTTASAAMPGSASSVSAVAPQPETPAAGPVGAIAIKLGGAADGSIDLRFVERRGQVEVQMKTSNPQSARAIIEDLSELKNSLNANGWDVRSVAVARQSQWNMLLPRATTDPTAAAVPAARVDETGAAPARDGRGQIDASSVLRSSTIASAESPQFANADSSGGSPQHQPGTGTDSDRQGGGRERSGEQTDADQQRRRRQADGRTWLAALDASSVTAALNNVPAGGRS